MSDIVGKFGRKRGKMNKIAALYWVSVILFFPSSLRAAKMPHEVQQKSQKYFFSYEVEIPAVAADSKKRISLCIHYPKEDDYQKVLKFRKKLPWPVRLTQESKYGNKIIFTRGFTSLKPQRFTFEFEIERFPSFGAKKEEPFSQPSLYLNPDRLVPFFPEIEAIAKAEAKDTKKPSEKIRVFYDYVVKTMAYDKRGEGWGHGDAVWACQAKRGNCTDFHSLFIAMSRTQKIPARFEMGVPIPSDLNEGEIPGYHCWAEAYADDLEKWIPIDATEAKKSGKAEEYFGKLPNNRILFSQGRDIVLNPAQKGEPLNYFIYPYAELDGKEFREIKKVFYFKKI